MKKIYSLSIVFLVMLSLSGCKSWTQSDILGKWEYIDIANPYNMDSIQIIWEFADGTTLRITRRNKNSATAPVQTQVFEYSIPAYDKLNIWSASSSDNVEIYHIRTLNSEMMRIQKMQGNSVAVTHEFMKVQSN